MADVKKPDKAPAKPAPPKNDPFTEIVGWMIVFFLGIYLLNGFAGMFGVNGTFSHGFQGLTPLGIMQSHTRPIDSLLNPIGSPVVEMNTDGTAVYDSPGGNQIGWQAFNARGKILQGYVEVNGQKYWYVDFDKGTDGWVKESDIAYLQSQPTTFENVIMWLWSTVSFFKIFSVLLSLFFIFFTAYILVKLTEIRKKARALAYPNVITPENSVVNSKWQKILSQVDSLNENDWKLAIIEADIMLSDILDKLQLPGDTMGEKMKAVEKSDFTTIDLAWEAHKIRNSVAHEGSDFVLTAHEARRVIGLYKAIFEEFQII